jgi:hypothetical protein
VITIEQEGNKNFKGPAVGIDLGWRLLGEELRVAFWHDETGASGQLSLPKPLLDRFATCFDLRSIQDKNLQTAKAALQVWASEHDSLPQWMDLNRLPEWHSGRRLERLYKTWRQNRFDGDMEVFAALEHWHERFVHLYSWEANLRDKIIRRRREIYRRFVAQFVSTHGRIFIEKFDLRRVVRRPSPESSSTAYAGHLRVIAAVSTLRTILEQKGMCERIEAANTTQRCADCGNSAKWDAAINVMHACSGCGRVFDQDDNAARNLLSIGLTRYAESADNSGGPACVCAR